MREFLRQLFIPQEKNNFRAKLLQPSFLAFLVGIFLLNQVSLNLIALAKPGVLGYVSDITPEAIVRLTNQERAKRNLPPLRENSLLDEAARRKAADMFAFDYWAHSSPSGRTPWSFFKEVGYNYVVAGENLAKDFSNPDAVVAAWMRSSTHRANILDERFQDIGVAVVEGTLNGYKTTLVVQLFGTPSQVMKEKEKKIAAGVGVEERSNPPLPQETFVSQSSSLGKKVINPMVITKGISGFLFGLIAGAILADTYFVFRNRVHRFSGRNLAHAGFLAVVFFLIFLSQQGVID